MSKMRVLGIDSEAIILPGLSVEIVTRPQLPFKGRRIHVPFEIARHFEIQVIRVGYNHQQASSAPIPADTFSVTPGDDGDVERKGEPFDFDTAQVGVDIAFRVRNLSTFGIRFTASILGEELDNL